MEANYFTILWWFLPYIDMNQPWACMCPPFWTPLPPPSPSHPSGSSQCSGFECPVSCPGLGLVIYFTYGSIPVSTLFSQIIPPSPFPTESKVCSLHLCLFCCVVYRVIVTIFLSSIYMFQYTVLVFFFLTYFTLYNGLQFHPPHWNWFKCVLFDSWVTFHCVYIPQLPYPFVCWWASRLLPCPGYCKQCCNEHWGTRVSFSSGIFIQKLPSPWHRDRYLTTYLDPVSSAKLRQTINHQDPKPDPQSFHFLLPWCFCASLGWKEEWT